MHAPARGLSYVDDQSPGITRRRRGRYWQYFDPSGKRIADRDGIDRLNAMLEPVAEALGNAPAISRKSYVHPALVDAVKAGKVASLGLQCPRPTKYLSSAERGLIRFLDKAGRKRSKTS